MAASALLAIAPFAFPKVSIGPFILGNWLLFMLVGYLAIPKFGWRAPLQKMEPGKFKLFRFVLIAFAVAGWIAIFNGKF